MTMKKFINQPERFIDEMLYGLYAAHPSYYTCVNEDAHCLEAGIKLRVRLASQQEVEAVIFRCFWDMSVKECWMAAV